MASVERKYILGGISIRYGSFIFSCCATAHKEKKRLAPAAGMHEINEAITMTTSSLELRTKITSEARLELWLERVTVPKPAADEVVVRIDAAPLNPSDIILLLGHVDPASIQAGGTPTHPTAFASIPPERMLGLEARLDRALPAGNEGAGIVVDAVQAGFALPPSVRRTPAHLSFGYHLNLESRLTL
jgi:hypothetical protein